MQSDAAGCDPSQVSEQQSMMLEHHGITTEFNKKTGAAIFRDRHHRRKHMEAVGLYDRNGGYGDAMPNPGRHRQE